jgi:phage major head subunit gpT-like protein
MANPSVLRANFTDLIGSSMLPVLEELFTSSYSMHPMRRDMFFKKETTDTAIWQYSEVHDMPKFSTVNEGQDYTFSAPKQGYHNTVTMLKYGLGFSISEEAVDDGKFGFIADAVKKMGKSARESQEQAAMDILNNGFTSTLTSDGLPLFSSAHTTPSGVVTIRNQLTTTSDLTDSSLKTMISDFRKQFRGDSGIVNEITAKYLIVPEELRLQAKSITQSERVLGSNFNDKNVIADEGLIVISSPHLTDRDGWFLCADAMDNGLRFIERKPLETKAAGADVGFMNDAIYYKARYRQQLAAVHANGIFGTPGV